MHHLVGEEEENVIVERNATMQHNVHVHFHNDTGPRKFIQFHPFAVVVLLKTTPLNAGDCMNG